MSSQPPPPAPKVAKRSPDDLIQRGVYKSSPIGTATFIGLRALDPFLQYQLLANGWGVAALSKLGLATVPAALGLPLPLPRQILLAMAVGSTAKQVLWLTYICREEFGPSAAITVSVFNTVVNSINSLLLLAAGTSAALASPSIRIPGTNQSVSLPIAVGTVMYLVGIALETIPEIQRKWFKDQPENKGKICRTGLWGLARHINYGGYTLWRGGYSLAAGGWIPGVLAVAFQAQNFVGRAFKVMDDYMTERYGEQWSQYKSDVPYLLIPGIY